MWLGLRTGEARVRGQHRRRGEHGDQALRRALVVRQGFHERRGVLPPTVGVELAQVGAAPHVVVNLPTGPQQRWPSGQQDSPEATQAEQAQPTKHNSAILTSLMYVSHCFSRCGVYLAISALQSAESIPTHGSQLVSSSSQSVDQGWPALKGIAVAPCVQRLKASAPATLPCWGQGVCRAA